MNGRQKQGDVEVSSRRVDWSWETARGLRR